MPASKLLLMLGVVAGLLVTALLHPNGFDRSTDITAVPVIRTPTCEVPTPRPETAWTIYVYCNADSGVVNTSNRFAQMLQSRENVTVLMLEDPIDGGAILWRIDGTPEQPILTRMEEWEEVDMGDDTTMARFLAFGDTWYPAERQMVMLYSHGYAWKGTCHDKTPSETDEIEPSWLSPPEMEEAFASIGGIDAVVFTAPCIAGSMEAAYQVRDVVDLFVASEAVSSLVIWDGVLPRLLDVLNTQDVALASLAQWLPAWSEKTYDREALLATIPEAHHPYIPTTVLSSVQGGEVLGSLAEAVDAFAEASLATLDTNFEGIYQARTEAQSFAMNVIIDAYDLAERCAALPGLEEVSKDLMDAVSEAILCSVTSEESHPNAHGLSLYFPMSYLDATDAEYYHLPGGFGTRGEEYLNYGLSLVEETHWDEFLVAFYEELLARYDTSESSDEPEVEEDDSDQSAQAEVQPIAEAPITRTEACALPEAPLPEKAWTVYAYCNADSNVTNVSIDFARALQSRENVNVLMLEDPANGDAILWRIDGTPEQPILTRLEEWGEVDMGDDTTMARFLAFGTTWYPAEQTMVMLYSHGGGWRGACHDKTPSATEEIEPTWLTPLEMAEAFGSIGGIDAAMFTAPCTMASIEAIYEVRDVVDLYVASEAISGFNVWNGVFSPLLDMLDSNSASIDAIGEAVPRWADETRDRSEIIKKFPEEYHPYITDAILSSVQGGDSLDALARAIDAFANSLIAELDTSFEAIHQARTDTQSFGMNALIDAFDFAERCKALPGLGETAQCVMDTVTQAVLYFVTDTEMRPGGHGLSLYFPMSYTDATDAEYYHQPGGFGTRHEEYLGYGLSLLEETHWDEFLVAFYEELLARYDVPSPEEADTETKTETETETQSSSGH